MAVNEEDSYSELHEKWVRGRPQELEELLSSSKKGRWTPDELALLRSNVDAFMKSREISDLEEFVFIRKRGERSDFYKTVAKGIRRPLFRIYMKINRLYNIKNYVGAWTKKKEKKLIMLYGLHGNKWTVIGRELGVSARAAQDKYRNISNRERVGKWSISEEKKLSSAVRTHGTQSWQTIAQCVETRNSFQCRNRWVNNQAWLESGGVKQWSECDDVQLLHSLAATDVETEDYVDWNGLAQNWEAARSGSYLRSKWSSMRKCVPRYQHNMFSDNLEYLLKNRLPALENIIADKYSTD